MQNASKLFGWVAESATQINVALEDGLQLTDALVLVAIVQNKPDFKTVFSEAAKEVVAASDEEVLTLRKSFNAKLELTSEKAEKVSEESVSVLLSVLRLAHAIKS